MGSHQPSNKGHKQKVKKKRQPENTSHFPFQLRISNWNMLFTINMSKSVTKTVPVLFEFFDAVGHVSRNKIDTTKSNRHELIQF